VGIVRGAATERRTFLDMELSQLNPGYLHALQQYRQVLRQRNELLRSPRVDGDILAPWDIQLAQWATVLIRDRRLFVSALDERTQEAYELVSGGERLGLRYIPNIRPDENPLDILQRGRDTDLRRGLTMRGPHRDDLEFTVANEAARAFASQGQQRTAALALKLADAALVHARTGEYPILMLDDVLSELDANRSRRLFRALSPGMQCLLTTTDLVENRDLFGSKAVHYRIKGGHLART
jgi:DNA replication and repair protein RecF